MISKQIGITLDKKPEIIPGSYLDRLLQGSQIQDKVTNVVLENVSAKGSFARLRDDLQTLIVGNEEVNGAMEKYLRTYAYDSFSVVQRSIDKNLADTYAMNCFVYEGNLIKDSREFCIEHLGKIICRDEIEEIEGQDWAGKNPDIPFELSLGGYNCRHTAMWIPDEAKEYFEEGSETKRDSEKEIESKEEKQAENEKLSYGQPATQAEILEYTEKSQKDLVNLLDEWGFETRTSISQTDFGVSGYVHANHPDINGTLKFRISDHSVGNKRFFDEVHFLNYPTRTGFISDKSIQNIERILYPDRYEKGIEIFYESRSGIRDLLPGDKIVSESVSPKKGIKFYQVWRAFERPTYIRKPF